MVLDPGCMKCMDCVKVCPNNALYFGFSSPPQHATPQPPFRRHQNKYDFTWSEDLSALAVVGITIYAMRGLYDGPPFLLAVALGVITGFLTVVTVRVFRH